VHRTDKKVGEAEWGHLSPMSGKSKRTKKKRGPEGGVCSRTTRSEEGNQSKKEKTTEGGRLKAETQSTNRDRKKAHQKQART